MIEIYHIPGKTYVFYGRPRLQYWDDYYQGKEEPHFNLPAKERYYKVYSIEFQNDYITIRDVRWRFF